jgi:hypothetical protein
LGAGKPESCTAGEEIRFFFGGGQFGTGHSSPFHICPAADGTHVYRRIPSFYLLRILVPDNMGAFFNLSVLKY